MDYQAKKHFYQFYINEYRGKSKLTKNEKILYELD